MCPTRGNCEFPARSLNFMDSLNLVLSIVAHNHPIWDEILTGNADAPLVNAKLLINHVESIQAVPFFCNLRVLRGNTKWSCQSEFVRGSQSSQHCRQIFLLQAARCVKATKIFIKTHPLIEILAASQLWIQKQQVSHQPKTAQKSLLVKFNSTPQSQKPKTMVQKHTKHSNLRYETISAAAAGLNNDRMEGKQKMHKLRKNAHARIFTACCCPSTAKHK